MLLEDMAAKTLYPLQFFCLQTVFSGQEDLGCQKMFLLLIQVEVQEEGEEMAVPSPFPKTVLSTLITALSGSTRSTSQTQHQIEAGCQQTGGLPFQTGLLEGVQGLGATF